MTKNIKKYIVLKNKLDETEDFKIVDKIQDKLEELYFELDVEEVAFLEEKEYI